ncbi:MAG: precorrin-3B C(17)-methyltransferase [Synechococcus sp.]
MPQSFAPAAIAIIAPTPAAVALGHRMRSGLPQATIWTRRTDLDKTRADSSFPDGVRFYDGSFKLLVEQLWSTVDAIIFILATGASVRLIAPLLTHKHIDPAVLAVDETGHYVIPLCGSHVAGGEQLARQISALVGATAAFSSGSSAYQLPALDTLGESLGWRRGKGDWTEVASAILRAAASGTDRSHGATITVHQTCGWEIWRDRLPSRHPFRLSDGPIAYPAGEKPDKNVVKASLWISDRKPPRDLVSPYVCWHPRTLWLGVGCERGTTADTIETAIRTTLQTYGLAWESIAGLASIDLKQDERGLLELARTHSWPTAWYPADRLASVTVPNPSAVVKQAVGTPSVAEAAALLAANSEALIVEKQVTQTPQAGACTVAIARAQQEYSDRNGRLYLVGIGPGALDQITPAARAAIGQADVVVGYQLYLDLIAPFLSPQQIVRASPITQEVQRAETAIAVAQRGLSVAVISSGDCGIYGMAGLVMEQLAQAGWDGDSPRVEVLPGITALQAAAARVGTPLMHDFCAISLSDLLTPWDTIERRLKAAAIADFVVALYNPRSRTRTQGLIAARDIFLQHRSPNTPVSIVKSAYRPAESTKVTTLKQFDVTEVDMLSTVLIGNSSTFIHANHPITPRGYRTQ